MLTLTIATGRSLSRRALPAALVAMLASAHASAALTAALDRPGAALREHDAFTLVLTLSNTGGFAITNLSAVLRLSVPEGVAVESAPVIASTAAIPANDSLKFIWGLRARRAGPETLTVQATGFSKGSSLLAEAVRVEAIAPNPGAIAAYPNPVGGDRLTVVLNLDRDADAVTAEVFNAAFRRVAVDTWNDVPRSTGRVTIDGVSRWAPGIYAVRVRVRYVGGDEREFPAAKIQVKR